MKRLVGLVGCLTFYLLFLIACGNGEPVADQIESAPTSETAAVVATHTVAPASPTPLATAVPTATASPTPPPTATATVIPSSTPITQPAIGEWSHLEVITPENVAQLVGIGVWDAATLPNLNHTISPDGRWLLSYDDHTLQGWDFATGQERFLIQLEDAQRHLALSPDGRYLATVHDDGRIHLWNAADGQHLTTIDAHSEKVTTLVFSPNSQRLASGGDDKTAAVWDVVTGELVQRFSTDFAPGFLQFSPDGTHLAVSLPITLFAIETGQEVARFEEAWELIFGEDSELVAIRRNEYGYSSPVQSALQSPAQQIPLWELDGDYITQYWLDENGRYLTIGYVNTQPLAEGNPPTHHWLLWDMASRHIHLQFEADEQVDPLGFSPDGRLIASGSLSGTVELWDVASGELLLTLNHHTERLIGMVGVPIFRQNSVDDMRGLVFSEDGRLLITAAHDGTIRFWSVLAAP
ncbi:WD40 repeat domain-containing protein [Candidatus Leptofilum sp.]|uniref:WD40 repeat domain-containing protein n=1 Tax=Candidatus Leptofilum sp. TaxID=3241576 RepID=UPI003B5CA020